MAVESPDKGRIGGIAMEIPAIDGVTSMSPPTMPPSLRKRMSETRGSPPTVEEIEAKLRGADLRRQKFYEYLSSKARSKPRSPSESPSHEEDRARRLASRLEAAERKRLGILAKAQMRLARLDELRQAAKNGVEMRSSRERAELGTKMELRVQQAAINRMHLLKANRQKSATLRERTSQSILRRMARESKYKERVRSAICQKRAAAEKKRLGLLEAEMKRAHARVLQVRQVAKSISQQREVERREMKNKIDNKLQRAKKQRAELLMQRGRSNIPIGGGNWNKMHEQADVLSRKLARCWRQFLKQEKTTLFLAKAFDSLYINAKSAKSISFEQLALLIESSATLQTTKALLDRLESRFKLSRRFASAYIASCLDDIDHLLKRVASPKRRATPRKSVRSHGLKKPVPDRQGNSSVKLSRYQVRVVLCAYMILGHPDAVFSGRGEREIVLTQSAEKFVSEFELLIQIIINGPLHISGELPNSSTGQKTFRSQLAAFDSAWCSYLSNFVMWKVKDVQTLEDDLVRAACQLELSMIQTCKITPEGDSGALTHDMKAIQKQVTEDLRLLREKVHHLSGDAGIQRMENALSDTRAKYFQARENGSLVVPQINHIISPSSGASSLGSTAKRVNLMEGNEKSSRVVRSLFKDEVNLKEVGGTISGPPHYSGDMLEMENELIVNESVHGKNFDLGYGSIPAGEAESSIEAKVRGTMENAFWDGILESIRKDNPKYSRIVELMREARDEICSMVPQSWIQEITEAIDLDILSQVLISGALDMDYLRKIMEFTLTTLQKLSAPADENELRESHQKFMHELAEICMSSDANRFVIALVKGLRFVLEQIQGLKQQISKARISLLEPLLKGPAALDYLRGHFTRCYGTPPDSLTSLPMTKQWLSSVREDKDHEWNEHIHSVTELARNQESSSPRFLPSTALRTGGSFHFQKNHGSVSAGITNQHPECKGEKVDLFVRIGLLKLAFGISGLTQDVLAETLKLNLLRLRNVQAKIQKIIVISTSILLLRQTALSGILPISAADMESIVSTSVKDLSLLLDSVENAGIDDIVKALSQAVTNGCTSVDKTRLQSMKEMIARMLAKSLQADDAIFLRVSRAIFLAARGILLGGDGEQGRGLAEVALRQVGAAALIEELIQAASVLLVVAEVSVNVHGPWYARLMENL